MAVIVVASLLLMLFSLRLPLILRWMILLLPLSDTPVGCDGSVRMTVVMVVMAIMISVFIILVLFGAPNATVIVAAISAATSHVVAL